MFPGSTFHDEREGAPFLLPGLGEGSVSLHLPASSQQSAGGQGKPLDQAGFLFGTFSDLGLSDRSVMLPHGSRRKQMMLPPSSACPMMEGLLTGSAALTSQLSPFLEVSHPLGSCREVGLLGLR